MKYGKTLQKMIKDAGYKQCEIAEQFGMSAEMLSAVLRGYRKPFDVNMTIALVCYLTTDMAGIDDLLTMQAEELQAVEFLRGNMDAITWQVVRCLRDSVALQRLSDDQLKAIDAIVQEAV